MCCPVVAPSPAATREARIIRHLPLVRHVARRFGAGGPAPAGLDYEDLGALGTEGLIRAIDRFDPARGVPFATWAVLHIRGTILDELRRLDPVPRAVRERGKAIDQASNALAQRTGAWPTLTAVAAALGVPVAQVREVQAVTERTTVSLDRPHAALGTSDPPGGAWAEALVSPDAASEPGQGLEEVVLQEQLARLVAALPPREATIIHRHHYEGYRLKDLAAEFGVSAGRVSQLYTRALGRLRAALAADAEADGAAWPARAAA
jgi:FliA/WhiG family RNA polymerase sigma factor